MPWNEKETAVLKDGIPLNAADSATYLTAAMLGWEHIIDLDKHAVTMSSGDKEYSDVYVITRRFMSELIDRTDWRLRIIPRFSFGSFATANCGIHGLQNVKAARQEIRLEIPGLWSHTEVNNKFDEAKLKIHNVSRVARHLMRAWVLHNGEGIQYNRVIAAGTVANADWLMANVKGFADQVFGQGVHEIMKLHNVGMHFMSDTISSDKPNGTQGFAKYLATNKVGVLHSSPVVRNPTHGAVTESFSYVQAWTWVPPKQVKYAARPKVVRAVMTRLPKLREVGERIVEEATSNPFPVYGGGYAPNEAGRKRALEVDFSV